MTPSRPPILAGLVLGILLAACGSHANLQRHALAAQVLHDAATSARAVVLEQLEADVASVTAGVTEPAERARLAAGVRARYTAPGGPVDMANAINRLGLAYVRSVLVLEQEDRPAWAKVAPLLRDALAVYVALRRVVGDRLPAVPAVVLELAGAVS